jgi:hypothetical protein
MPQVTGAFKVLGWDEKSYDDALIHADATYELLGDIEGEASVSYLMGYGANGVASFVGLARVTGRVRERDGSFVMQDVGRFENGVARGSWTVLPGLGTGGLEAIRGAGDYTAGHDDVSYALELSF